MVCTDFELEMMKFLRLRQKREFGNEKNKLIIQPIGIMVIEFLIKTYTNLFEYSYTKEMEDILDIIAKGEKQYYELCSECLNEIHKASGEITRNNKKIEIDPNHTYMIGKYGPVIKCTANGIKNPTFKSVRKDIDLDKIAKR